MFVQFATRKIEKHTNHTPIVVVAVVITAAAAANVACCWFFPKHRYNAYAISQ